MKLIKQIITAILIVLVFVILLENYDALNKASSFKFNLHFIGWYTSPMPVWLIILIAFACGYAIAHISGFMQKMSYKKRIKQLEHDVNESSPSNNSSQTKDTEDNAEK